MNITINMTPVAQAEILHIGLRPTLGSYELQTILRIDVPALKAEQVPKPHWLTIHSAELFATGAGGSRTSVGICRPNQPFRTQQSKFDQRTQLGLRLSLSPAQIAAIEDLRNTGNLDFEFGVYGEGGDGTNIFPIFDSSLRKNVPESQWIEVLRSAKVFDILLIEIPMPFVDPPIAWKGMLNLLKEAQSLFIDGHYPQCVAKCRDVLDTICGSHATQSIWTEAFKLLDTNEHRKEMTKEQCELAVFAAARHYTHGPHHPKVAGGTDHYSRSEAKLVPTLCACLASRVLASGTP